MALALPGSGATLPNAADVAVSVQCGMGVPSPRSADRTAADGRKDRRILLGCAEAAAAPDLGRVFHDRRRQETPRGPTHNREWACVDPLGSNAVSDGG